MEIINLLIVSGFVTSTVCDITVITVITGQPDMTAPRDKLTVLSVVTSLHHSTPQQTQIQSANIAFLKRTSVNDVTPIKH